jgi:hypothetical protein
MRLGGDHVTPWTRCGLPRIALPFAATLVLTGCGASAQVWTGPSETVTAYPGARHCNLESALFLDLGDAQYVFDPGSTVERQMLVSEPEEKATLPPDAVDTGLRRSDAELWLAANGDAVYVVSGDGVKNDSVQKWPRAVEPIVCS